MVIYVRYKDYGSYEGEYLEFATSNKDKAFKVNGNMIYDCVKVYDASGEELSHYEYSPSHKEWVKARF